MDKQKLIMELGILIGIAQTVNLQQPIELKELEDFIESLREDG